MKSIQNNSEDLDSNTCLICGNIPGENSIVLRNEAKVCPSCLDGKEWECRGIELRVEEANTPKIKIYYYSFYILISLCLYSLVFTEYFLDNFQTLGLIWMILTSIVVLSLYCFKKIKIKLLLNQLRRIIKVLAPIFEQMWKKSPDWDMRKKAVRFRDRDKCSKCGSIMFASPMVFHLHHVIPKKEAEGSHKISNLILLCEDCHGYQASKGHELIRYSGNYKYKYRHKLFPQKYRPIIKAWIEAYGIRFTRRNKNEVSRGGV